MKRRGFLINTTAILLLIPLLLLLATYENASSQIINAQGERIQTERTYDIVNYISLDFQKALELSGKRALVAAVDYVATTGNFINPNVMANNTIKALIIHNTSNTIWSDPDVVKLMKNQDIQGWFINVSNILKEQGYHIEPNVSSIVKQASITVAPLDAFHIVIKARLPNVTIVDTSGEVIYTGSIPRKGYVYAIINIQQLEDPYYAVMSRGKYHRSIRACDYAFPAFTPPFIVTNGSGQGTTVAGIFGKDFKYNSTTIWDTRNSSIYILNTTIDGTPVQPDQIGINESDMGVMTFNASSSTVSWCDAAMEHRVDVSLPSTAPLNSLVLLVFDTASISSSFGSAAHDGNRASIVVYPKDSCVPAPYWIEYWGTDKILIWLNTTSTRDYTIYYSTNPALESSGDINIFPYHAQNIELTAGSKKSSILWTNVDWNSFFVRYSLTASSKYTDFDGGIGLNWSSTSNADYLVINASYDRYPYSATDVQIPIYLNSTIAKEVIHNATTNEAEIGVYSDSTFNTPVPFWIEYWNDNGALIWVRGNLPETYYIRYNTGTLTRGNGSQVFLFFDNFSYLTAGMTRKDILTALKDHGWNFGGRRIFLGSGDGILKLRGDTTDSTSDVWLWTKKTFPYYSYVVGMEVKANSPVDQGWLWYIDSTDEGWMEDVYYDNFYRGYYGHLYDFNVDTGSGNYYDDGGSYLMNAWTQVEIAIKDYWRGRWGHYANVVTYQNQTGPFIGTWSGNTFEVSYYDGIWDDIYAENNTAIGLAQFYEGPSEYKFIYVRKYLNLNYLVTTVENAGATNVSQSVQFVDDNPGHPDLTGSGDDWLVILKNWNALTWSTQTTGYKDTPNRYEVDVIKGAAGLKLKFIHSPNLTTQTSSVTLNSSPTTLNMLTVIDNTQNNNANFSWIVAAPYPYVSYPNSELVVYTPQTKPSSSNVARAYDIQPFINCIQDDRYFAINGGMSFFERLEGSTQNHDAYVKLAHEMQDELGYKYNGEYYPIGLVSFLIPSSLYDERLVNIFNNLGIQLDNTSDADYYFLPHYFEGKPGTKGYRVWGVSYGVTSDGDLSQVPFYIDPKTAAAIFGPLYYSDLLYGYG